MELEAALGACREKALELELRLKNAEERMHLQACPIALPAHGHAGLCHRTLRRLHAATHWDILLSGVIYHSEARHDLCRQSHSARRNSNDSEQLPITRS